MYRKNVAGQYVLFQGVDASTGGIKSGVTWTVRRCIDGGFGSGSGTVTEDGTTGWYKYAMAQVDTNGNDISFNFTGSGAVPQTINIVTTAADPTNGVYFGLSCLPNTAVTTNGSLLTSGTGSDQLSVTGGKVLLQATQTGVTIPTVTTLTNLPSIPSNWLTSAGIAASALNGKGDWALAGSAPSWYSAAPSAATVATTIWSDLLSGSDFSTAGSVGAAIILLKAAVYDSATVSGNVISLSNGHTQTITTGGRSTS
jgi:hypothetical protein